MKKNLPFLLSLVLLLCACAPQAVPTPTEVPPVETASPTEVTLGGTTTPFQVTDALGRSVSFAQAPRRIVITAKALFMIADAVYMFPEAADRVLAMGNTGQGSQNFISMIDPNYAAKAILEENAGAEQIAALQPDLVILKSYHADTVGAPIEALGIPVVYIDFETPEQYLRDLVILGEIFQNQARASELVDYYRSRTDEIQRRLGETSERPSVLMLYYSTKDGAVAFKVPPMGWMQTQIVEMAGGDPVWEDANPGDGWAQVTLEQIAAWDADHIFIIAYNINSAEVVDTLKGDPNWQAIRALQEGNLHAFPADVYSWDQPDTRWILGLTWLANRLHPDLFPGIDIVSEVRDFYQTLYGLGADFFDQNILLSFRGDIP